MTFAATPAGRMDRLGGSGTTAQFCRRGTPVTPSLLVTRLRFASGSDLAIDFHRESGGVGTVMGGALPVAGPVPQAEGGGELPGGGGREGQEPGVGVVVHGRGQGVHGPVQVTAGAVEQAVQVPRYLAMRLRLRW
jgi:hypothetical protein